MPRPQTDNDQKTDLDKIDFSKLQIGQDNPKEGPMEITDLLVPPPMTNMTEDTTENTTENMAERKNNNKLSEAERRLQEEEENYELHQRIYVGQLSDEKESDTE